MSLPRLIIVLLCLMPSVARALGTTPVTIETADGRAITLSAELAQTPEEQSRGLMNRPSLPADQGMLFDFGHERMVAMWMKNTLIPLDMLFIADDGKIVGIAQRTIPFSLDIISSPGMARAVLEVNGGTTDRLRIKAGDRLISPHFSH